MRVVISKENFQSLAEYSNITGISIEDLVDEALANYIEADLTSRLEGIAVKSASA